MESPQGWAGLGCCVVGVIRVRQSASEGLGENWGRFIRRGSPTPPWTATPTVGKRGGHGGPRIYIYIYIFCFHSRLWTDDSRKGLAGSQRVPVDFSQLVRWHTLCFSSGALTSVFYSLPEVSQSLSYLDFCSTCMSSRLRPTWAIQIIQAIQMNRQSHLLPSRELSQIRQCILSRAPSPEACTPRPGASHRV